MKKQTGEILLVKRSGEGLYIPDEGDVIWINFDPQAGNEQAKHRPALVITKMLYNSLPRTAKDRKTRQKSERSNVS